jgi:phenylacetic acid degradation protein
LVAVPADATGMTTLPFVERRKWVGSASAWDPILQDNCVVHTLPGKEVVLEAGAHIGHGAILHGCVIRSRALVGMNALVMDDALIGEEAFVGAASFVRAGFVVPPRTLVFDAPARIVRELSAQQIAWKATGTREYQERAERCLKTLKECQPLTVPESGRAEFEPTAIAPLHTLPRDET